MKILILITAIIAASGCGPDRENLGPAPQMDLFAERRKQDSIQFVETIKQKKLKSQIEQE